MAELPAEFIKKLNGVTAKRPATIIHHILKHGSISSEEIKELYGYNHPPRAIRDVREQGIPIETFHVKSRDGRNIAAYRFGDPSAIEDTAAKTHGRTALTKALKNALIEKYGKKCFIYQQEINESLLQIDHRIPYEIAGEGSSSIESYMLLSPSANRAKSWACEHCPNWIDKRVEFCIGCFWCHPENYQHIAGNQERRIVLTFTGDEIDDYNQLINQVGSDKAERTIKELIHNTLLNGNEDSKEK